MDPLSVAGGVAQFVGLAGQALQGIAWVRGQFKEIKAAPKLIKKIYHELRVFERTLAQLSSLEPSHISHEAAQSFTDTLTQCVDVFDELAILLTRYDFRRPESGAKKLWMQIAASDNMPKFEEHLSRLERAKSSLLTTMAGMNLQMTDNLARRQTAHAEHVEQSLKRIEAGLSSVSIGTESIYANTVEIKGGVSKVADILKNVDRSIQDLRTDFPALIETGIERALEKRLVDWFKDLELNSSKPLLATVGRRDSLVENTCFESRRRTRGPDRSTRLQIIHSSPAAKPKRSPFIDHECRFLPQHIFKTQAMCIRKKTYSSTFALPIGFVETKTTQMVYQNASNANSNSEKETLRVEIAFVPFRWLSSRGHAISIEKIYDQFNRASWTYTPRPYNIVSNDAMIISACIARDVDTVQKLFKYRKASPFDVDSSGATLMANALHKCDEEMHRPITKALELIRFLTSQGADPTPFIHEFLDAYSWFSIEYSSLDRLNLVTEEASIAHTLDEIWRFCLEHCQSDPFADIQVLEKLWNASLGGRCLPLLDSSYLFQENYSGLDELVYDNPEKVFADLTDKRARIISSGSDESWQRLLDQCYETLIYLCYGGEDSIKAKIFSGSFLGTVPRRREGSCFCPHNQSHLIFNILYDTELFKSSRTRQKPLRRHVHRMLVLLLQNGEDPEASCSCKAGWQRAGGFRTATDIAASEGLIGVWESALQETGFDATRIIDEWRMEGFQETFELPREQSLTFSNSVKFVRSTFLSAVSSIV
ncbi:hypothetical protein K469DRAFT_274118 [Zopfia rhizophila CBS 207.26]|uniref:Azaphilone pigments biosynthesis cluster protein L N-terminal domain-containing protein n=1 Tax=Zopfia rhizophila CBS 207.26 TaxID=1314779 RepID=A0A6A6DQD6_9PEZI|nr:hypothetical protein K469DRAFT_274118 [Zopfia rhizophila CBS 207.26]